MKLLMVDDEFSIRTRIMQQIDWTRIGIAEVEQAKDGAEALHKTEYFTPDILLTDVRMPYMDGIELATEMTRRFPNIKIIFISGYTDKEYLQSAITLRALRYIEKPINVDELYGVLQETVDTIIGERSLKQEVQELRLKNQLKEMQKFALLLTQSNHMEEVRPFLEKGFPGFAGYHFFVTIIVKFTHKACGEELFTIDDQMLQQVLSIFETPKIHALCAQKYQQLVIHLMGSPSGSQLSHYSFLEKGCNLLLEAWSFRHIQAVCGIGAFVDSWKELHHAYETAVLAVQQSFFKQPGCICYYKTANLSYYNFENFHLSEFSHSLKKDRPDYAVFLIRSLASDIKRYDNTLPSNVFRLFFSMIQELSRMGQKEDFQIFDNFETEQDIWAYINQLFFLDQLVEFLVAGINRYYQRMQEDLSDNVVVNRIVRFIKMRYNNPDLCITMISEHLNLSSTYICHLFKDVTGMTLNNYLTDYRMRKAKEMIGDPNQKVKDIAGLVGYRNGNYFSYQFKKYTGLSPSEYREQIL